MGVILCSLYLYRFKMYQLVTPYHMIVIDNNNFSFFYCQMREQNPSSHSVWLHWNRALLFSKCFHLCCIGYFCAVNESYMYKRVELSCSVFCEAVSSCGVIATQNEWDLIVVVGGPTNNITACLKTLGLKLCVFISVPVWFWDRKHQRTLDVNR